MRRVLYRSNGEVTEKDILETFEESGVLNQFKKLTKVEQDTILQDIIGEIQEEKQIKKISNYIDKLNN